MRYPLYVDFDNTIYDPYLPGIYQSTIDALELITKKYPVDLYLTTGRSANALSELEPIIKLFKGFILTNSGHIIIDGKTRFVDTIDRDVVIKFSKFMIDHKYNFVVVTPDVFLEYFFEDDTRKRFHKTVKAPIDDIKNKDIDYYSNCIQLWPVVEKKYLDIIKKEFPMLDFFYWGSKLGADVVKHGRNKATGIKVVNELMHYDLENCFAIGDSDNDVPMLEYVPNSICMGRSSDKAKKASKYLTGQIEEDGFSNAIYDIVIKKIENK